MKRACRVLRSLSIAGVCSLVTTYPTLSVADPRAVVELFTSQGCSSCPPADKLMGELAGDGSLIVMSLPIDYWDYLGWKDTLARPRHTARQRGYATKRGDREVYTPQAVINGVVHVIGSDRKGLENAIERTNRPHAALSVPVRLAFEGDHVQIAVSAAETGGPTGEIWLCGIAKAVPVAVGRGENRGHKITYHNVVRRWVKLGAWSGAAETFRLAKSELEGDGIDTVAVLVQVGSIESPSMIVGATVAPLR
jgi:hypothetical protein